MRRVVNVMCLLAVAGLVPATASAVLQSLDDPVHGPGSITRDTDTGLEWLDLTNTYNQSFVYVSSQFTPGSDYAGFRHGTFEEVKLYWEHGGMSVDTGWSVPNYAPCRSFQVMVGHSEPTPEVWQAVGFTVEDAGPGFRNLAYINSNSTPQQGAAASNGAYQSDDVDTPDIGHWLVRPMPPVGVESTTWTGIRQLFQ